VGAHEPPRAGLDDQPCRSFLLRDLRASGFPALPAVPASSLDGKEGRVRQRAKKKDLQIRTTSVRVLTDSRANQAIA
jgi:hypothetical protein